MMMPKSVTSCVFSSFSNMDFSCLVCASVAAALSFLEHGAKEQWPFSAVPEGASKPRHEKHGA
jgi:hypothetical protein